MGVEQSEEYVGEILHNVDFNNSNSIDFTEFVVSNINFKKNLKDQKLNQIFDIIDFNKDGKIDKKELSLFFGLSKK